jgi:hypothetical protein
LGRKLPYKKVRNLPLGPGKGILITKKSPEPIRVSGEVVIVKGEKRLLAKKNNLENQNCIKLCFSPETRVLKWKSRAKFPKGPKR